MQLSTVDNTDPFISEPISLTGFSTSSSLRRNIHSQGQRQSICLLLSLDQHYYKPLEEGKGEFRPSSCITSKFIHFHLNRTKTPGLKELMRSRNYEILRKMIWNIRNLLHFIRLLCFGCSEYLIFVASIILQQPWKAGQYSCCFYISEPRQTC